MSRQSALRTNPLIFECTDSEENRFDANKFIQGECGRYPEKLTTNLVKQFININKGILNNFDIQASREYDGDNVHLVIKTGLKIGAFPLLSPTSGKPEYGMVIRPRFDWSGIGNMLAQMGWRVVPTLLRLPLLHGTERKIPSWVLSAVILVRIKDLLDHLDRRFELLKSIQPAPKGTVFWSEYATQKMPKANFLQIPCQFPDLRDDRTLKAAIHYTLRKQLVGLESQRNLAGPVIFLIELCQSLINRVSHIPPQRPSTELIQLWLKRPLQLEAFKTGIQAVEWTIEERGLAGITDIHGLPWILPMDAFFEAWIETLMSKVARSLGGVIKCGRKNETISPIHWDKPYYGTQKYLLPDLILEQDEVTYIIDAKYKRHWEEFQYENWYQIETEIQEQHRNDLLQVLAYSSLNNSKRVVTSIIYPCNQSTWDSLEERGELYRHATIPTNGRNIEVILTAAPMNGNIDMTVDNIRNAFIASLF